MDWFAHKPYGFHLRHVVARITYSNFAGSWYEYAKERGGVLRFWTRAAAQQHADKLNNRSLRHD